MSWYRLRYIKSRKKGLNYYFKELENRIDKKRLRQQQRASLVAQWLRICLPMQGTQVQALVQEDPTCSGATKPVHHNY